jgi:hypothetical protein
LRFEGAAIIGDNPKAAAWRLSQNQSMERAFSPYPLLLLHSWGSAPGWYEAAPSALKLMRNQIFQSAKGASDISLGQSPRRNRK